MEVDHHMKNSNSTESFSSQETDEKIVLQREKAQVELQMLRLKTNINALEFQLNHTERVSRF